MYLNVVYKEAILLFLYCHKTINMFNVVMKYSMIDISSPRRYHFESINGSFPILSKQIIINAS